MSIVNFAGQLNTNYLFSAIYNMIISQLVFADNLRGTQSRLVDSARVDGSMYGDTKLYYATDCLKSVDWEQDSETERNLLAVHRPDSPKCQAIKLDVFRQISLTLDDYMTKQAFADSNSFSNFNSVMLGWVGDTKQIYDATTYNVFIGTHKAESTKQSISITLPEQALSAVREGSPVATLEIGTDIEATARLEAQTIATRIADIIAELEDTSRDWNDYGFMRSYNASDFKFVWNKAWLNLITKYDLPTVFHKDIVDHIGDYALPPKYFGTINGATVTASDGLTIRSLIEQDVVDSASKTHHVFAGELIPVNVTLAAAGVIAYPSYTEDANVIVKLVHKKDIPYMSGFEVGTSFYNAKNLSTNHYLTYGHNTLVHLYNYPLVTVSKASE